LYWNDFMSASGPAPGEPVPLTPDGYFVWDRPSDGRGVLQRSASWLLSRSALLFALRQATASLGGAAAGSGYGLAYRTMLERGLSAEEWAIIEGFYKDLTALGKSHGFETLVVIMPVIDIVSRADAATHPYAVEARRRLAAAGIPFVDGFELWARPGLGAKHFLPQGADAHLDANGYQLLGEATARALRHVIFDALD
jgi:hypothetical protein